MPCTDCGKTEQGCGCEQGALHISQICNPIICSADECSETFKASCILYTGGEDIICRGVILATAGDNIAQITANIIAYFCEQTQVTDALMCGEDEVVPAETFVTDAISLVVDYFCTALENMGGNLTSTTVNAVDQADFSGCTIRTYTITFLTGITVIDTVVFSTPPICPPVDLCAQTLVTPALVTDTFVICRTTLGNTNIRRVTLSDIITAAQNVLPGNILSAYNSATGIGNTAGATTVNAISTAIPANTLAVNGDEYEMDLYLEYLDNDPVTLQINIGTGAPWIKIIQSAFIEKHFFNITISRISSNSQMWTISEHIEDNFGTQTTNLEVFYTTVNLGIAQNFTVDLINVGGVAGPNALTLHKAVLKYNTF